MSLLLANISHAQEDIIRLSLARLSIEDQIDLNLNCDCFVTDDKSSILLKSGSNINLRLINNKIYVYSDSINICLNAPVKLECVDKSKGFCINGSSNIYTGDLYIYIRDSKLFPVLYIELEEYLKGVVPYEMSDSFPIEALKAQAIAARTYALKHLKLQNSFDLVDTTNDQVYKGQNSKNTNAILAIESTKGICGFDGNSLATCYYSGSNGGQTELPQNRWNKSLNIYKMVDDSYDFNNPNSMVKRFAIKKGNPNLKKSAHDLISNSLIEYAKLYGFDTEYDNIKIDKINSISLSSPLYPAPSKVMSKIKINLNFSGKKEVPLVGTPTATPIPSPTPFIYTFIKPNSTPKPYKNLSDFIPYPESVNIEINIFNEARNAFGLSLNGGGKEIMNVIEADDAFIIESRRYGHGVGMSQRGAEQMARDGKSYNEILSYYYPGMTLDNYKDRNVQIFKSTDSPVDVNLQYTPEPLKKEPLPTPIPLLWDVPENIRTVIVNKIEENSFLNLRDEPNLDSLVVRRLYYGQRLVVAEDLGEWLHVFINKDNPNEAYEGYVVKDFVEFE